MPSHRVANDKANDLPPAGEAVKSTPRMVSHFSPVVMVRSDRWDQLMCHRYRMQTFAGYFPYHTQPHTQAIAFSHCVAGVLVKTRCKPAARH